MFLKLKTFKTLYSRDTTLKVVFVFCELPRVIKTLKESFKSKRDHFQANICKKALKQKKICSIFLISCNISQHKQRFWNVFILYIWPFPIFCTVMIGFAQIRKKLILLTKKVKCTCQPWRQGLIYIMTPLFDQKPLDLAGGKLC